MPFQPEVMDRMLLSKSLLGSIRFSPVARPDRMTLARHILIAHDAAELALAGIAHQRGKRPQQQQVHLMDYFQPLKELHPDKEVTGREYFNQLNRVRINIKHHGILPDQQQWYRVGERTYEYISIWCKDYLGLSLDDLDESYIIEDKEIKSLFDLAKQYFERNNYRETLESIGIALHILFSNNLALSNFHAGVSQAQDAIKLAAFGVNANDYLTLQEFLPRIKEDQVGTRRVEWEQEKFGHPGNWHRESADFCLRTFLRIILCVQNAEWIPRATAFIYVYEYKITALQDGVEIFIGDMGILRIPEAHKRKVIRILNKGEFIRGYISRPDDSPFRIMAIAGAPYEPLLIITPPDNLAESGFFHVKDVCITGVPRKHPAVMQHFPGLPEFELEIK